MVECNRMQTFNLISKAQAAEIDFTKPIYEAAGWDAAERGASVAAFVQPFLNVLYGIAALILLINIVLAGIKIAAKEKKGLEDAKKNLMNSIIGLVIVMLATVITNILMGIFVFN